MIDPETVPQQPAAEETIRFTRDSTFTRAVVDRVFALDLGRDLELACVQFGPVLNQLQNLETQEKIDMTPTFTEVVRIRIEWRDAVLMVMHLLEQGISSGRFNKEGILKTIANLSTVEEEKASGE